MSGEEGEQKHEEGFLPCSVCGAVCTIDTNNEADILEWIIQHVFGHSGNEK